MFRVLQITDTHLYEDEDRHYYDVNTDATLRNVLEWVLEVEEDASLVLMTGDLVHDESPQAYQRFHNYFSGLGRPVYCLPGNHDDFALMNSILSGNDVNCERFVLHGTWQFILLNSTVTGEVGGHLETEELDRLAACLQTHPDHFAVVCLHHPPLPSGCAWLDQGLILDNPGDLFNVLDAYANVRCVVWGHIHQEYDVLRNNVRLLGSPSTMLQFRPGSAIFVIDDAAPGYRWLDLYADGKLETGVIRLEGC